MKIIFELISCFAFMFVYTTYQDSVELVVVVNIPKQEMHDFSKQLFNSDYSVVFDLPRDSNGRDFMSGYVVRKWLRETGGRKAAFGKRDWKLFYGRFHDLTLYLYKDHDKSVTQSVNTTKQHHNAVIIKKSKSFKQSGDIENPMDHVAVSVAATELVIVTTTTTLIQSYGDHSNNPQSDQTDNTRAILIIKYMCLIPTYGFCYCVSDGTDSRCVGVSTPHIILIDPCVDQIQTVTLVPTSELALQTSQICTELAKHSDTKVMLTTRGKSLKDDIVCLQQTVYVII